MVLKERRRLVLMVRETPLHLGHLRSMTQVTEMGAIVMPPVPAFYSRPQTIDDIVNHTVGRVLDLFGIDNGFVRRWGGPDTSPAAPGPSRRPPFRRKETGCGSTWKRCARAANCSTFLAKWTQGTSSPP